MKLSVKHQTEYIYNAPLILGLQRLRLRPSSNSAQSVLNWNIQLEGASPQLQYTDPFGNVTELIKSDAGTQMVRISVEGSVDTKDSTGVFGHDAAPLPSWFFKGQTSFTRPGASLKKMAKSRADNDASIGFWHELVNEIRDSVAYEIGETSVSTTAEESLVQRSGVCQDHSHIMISVARELGFAARYVSGYLLIDGVVDQVATHAWCEIFLDNLGWVGFDVSNGVSPDERYVRLAVGRDYSEAAPIHGLRYGDAQESLDVHLQIQQ